MNRQTPLLPIEQETLILEAEELAGDIEEGRYLAALLGAPHGKDDAGPRIVRGLINLAQARLAVPSEEEREGLARQLYGFEVEAHRGQLSGKRILPLWGAPGMLPETRDIYRQRADAILSRPRDQEVAGWSSNPLNNLGWFAGLARKHGYHAQADWLDELQEQEAPTLVPPRNLPQASVDLTSPGSEAPKQFTGSLSDCLHRGCQRPGECPRNPCLYSPYRSK